MKKVLLLLANGFETFEACVFIDIIGWNLIDGDHSTKLYTCGITKEVKTSFDQNFIVDYTISEINPSDFDALAIPGGFEEYGFYKDGYSEDFSQLIRAFDSQNKIIASICVGALVIGKSGVLKGRNATTYFKQDSPRKKQLASFGVNVINNPIVVDDNIITSWNPSTAAEVAFLLLERLTTHEQCCYIKKIMGFN